MSFSYFINDQDMYNDLYTPLLAEEKGLKKGKYKKSKLE